MKPAIVSLLSSCPVLMRVLRSLRSRLLPCTSVSSHYVPLVNYEACAEGQRLRAAWQDDSLPQKQWKLVEQQLHKYRAGSRIDVFDVFVDCLSGLTDLRPGMTLLEIGCASGYYAEVLSIAGLPLKYEGCDYSDALIRLAQEKYPSIDFAVEDATALSYQDSCFEIVVSGGCLLHIPEYIKAIEESVRVAQCYVIFHRTPVVWGQPEQWYRKRAYGVETVEIHFNETEFLALLEGNGLELLRTHTLHEEYTDVSNKIGHAVRSYVCRKKTQ